MSGQKQDFGASADADRGSREPSPASGLGPDGLRSTSGGHWSDCAVHNEPATPAGPCDCGGLPEAVGFEGLSREPQSTFCVWNKYGHRPTYWHDDQESAEQEAARLARLHPGKTFIVFRKIVNIKTAATAPEPEQSA